MAKCYRRYFGLLLLRNQGPEQMPRMHRSLKAYCATLLTPQYVLDVPTFAARCLHVLHDARSKQRKVELVGENI